MWLLLGLVVVVVFTGLGFLSHVLWIGILVGLVLALVQLLRAGLNPSEPAGRLNIGLLRSLGRFLLEVTGRARGRYGATVPLISEPIPAQPARTLLVAEPAGDLDPVSAAPSTVVAPAASDRVDLSTPHGRHARSRAEGAPLEERSRRVTNAMLVSAAERLRDELNREPTVRELALHLGVPEELILDAMTVDDVIHAQAFDLGGAGPQAGR